MPTVWSKVHRPDGRLHTSFQNTVHRHRAACPPLSPTFRTFPSAPSWGPSCAKMFAAPAGRVLVDADYSQIELRLLAHIGRRSRP